MKNIFYVYVLFRPNGTPCYVGKGQGARWKKHKAMVKCHPNKHLSRIIQNAGGDIPAVIVREGLMEADAFATEIALIAAIGREYHGGPLVNQTDGGEGISGQTLEARQRTIAGIKARWADPECRAIMIANMTGRKVDDEARKKMSAAKIGKKHSIETRAKMRAAHAGRERSPEFGAAVTAGKTGKKASAETKAILRAANRSRDPEVRARISIATRAAMQRPDVKARMKLSRNPT